jgi:hypothetical protein
MTTFVYSDEDYFPYIPPNDGQSGIGPKILIGPTSQGILIKNKGNNAIINAPMGMPQKFNPSSNDSTLTNSRKIFAQDAGGGTVLMGNHDASHQIRLKKITAIGLSATMKNILPVSFQGLAQPSDHYRNSKLAKVRGGGCIAPKKKINNNSFLSGGTSRITGTGNRQIGFQNGNVSDFINSLGTKVK